MEPILTDKEKCEKLINQARRLDVFAKTFKWRFCPAVEGAAYSVLEVYQSRPRAVWRCFRFAVRSWRYSVLFSARYNLLLIYLRIKGLGREAAIERVCETLEEKYLGGK